MAVLWHKEVQWQYCDTGKCSGSTVTQGSAVEFLKKDDNIIIVTKLFQLTSV